MSTTTFRIAAAALLSAAVASACSGAIGSPGTTPAAAEGPARALRWPIVGGQLDTNATHNAVVFIEMYDARGQIFGACSGTLVSSKVILTAGHCVSDEQGALVSSPTRYGVYFDLNDDGTPDSPKTPCWLTCKSWPCNCRPNQNVAEVQRMSGFQMSWGPDQVPVNDIALLKLSAAAPAGVQRIPYLTSPLARRYLSDTSNVEFSGFGDQQYPGIDCCDNYGRPAGCHQCQNGTRFHVTGQLSSICRDSGGCSSAPPWTVSYNGASGPCSGDSGGPAFITVAGKQFVAGVTSYGDANCQSMGVSTLVDHFETFIASAIDDHFDIGADCSLGSECASGFCATGVCCSSACSGSCQGCSAALGAPVNGQCDLVEGLPCEDGDPCTLNDTCHAGQCTSGPHNDCPAPDGCHGPSTCDPATGACGGFPALPDGTACSDGDACTLNDHCVSGTCSSDDTVQCAQPNACQVSVTCDSRTGACVPENKPNGTACTDRNSKTANDHCVDGACVGDPAGECAGEADGTPCAGGFCRAQACEPSSAAAAAASPPRACGCGTSGAASGPGSSVLLAALALMQGRRRARLLARRDR